MAKPADPQKPSRSVDAVVYGALVLLALVGVALILLLPERSTAVGLVYQGF